MQKTITNYTRTVGRVSVAGLTILGLLLLLLAVLLFLFPQLGIGLELIGVKR